jgi:hypothetical protein
VVLDIAVETAQTFAMIDEHTAGIQQHQDIARLWRSRIAPDDARLAWNEAHEAWVRTLAGDRLTTEQLLEDKPSWLAAQLGEGHPYTRAVRLALAATLEARGARAEAASLRAQAERVTPDLLHGHGPPVDSGPGVGGWWFLDDAPVPPGVLAHVAPNAAEREGFRRGPGGGFVVPLTSIQRSVAARDGWRLHIVAAGTCRASFVAGTDPRLITVNATRSVDGDWQVRIAGTSPAITLSGAIAKTVDVSLVADATGDIEARLGDERARASLDMAADRAAPPYTLAFDGGSDEMACAVVWLEIPFPNDANFLRR